MADLKQSCEIENVETNKVFHDKVSGSENSAMSAEIWRKEKWQHQEFALPGAEEECVQFVAALMDDTAQILMRSVTSFSPLWHVNYMTKSSRLLCSRKVRSRLQVPSMKCQAAIRCSFRLG